MANQQGTLSCTITWFEDAGSGRGYFLAKFDDGGRHEIPEETCGGGPITAGSDSSSIAEAIASDLGLELVAVEHDGVYIHVDMRQPEPPTMSEQQQQPAGAWKTGEPPRAGYYLATWLLGVDPTVSELWFNPTGGGGVKWWAKRGYFGHDARGVYDSVPGPVVAWMDLPEPYQQQQPTPA